MFKRAGKSTLNVQFQPRYIGLWSGVGSWQTTIETHGMLMSLLGLAGSRPLQKHPHNHFIGHGCREPA